MCIDGSLLLFESTTERVGVYARSSSLSSLGQLIFFLLAFAAVLALAYVTAKLLAGGRARMLTGKNIKVVESIGLNVGTTLHLVKVGEKCLLLSVSKERVSLLTEVDPETIKEPEVSDSIGFDKVLKDCLNKFGQQKK